MMRFLSLTLILFISCNGADTNKRENEVTENSLNEPLILAQPVLASRFTSLDDFKSKIQVTYFNNEKGNISEPKVQLKLRGKKTEILCELKSGLSQADILEARDGNLLDKAKLTLRSPYTIRIRKDLKRVFFLARRMREIIGHREVAFYDLALAFSKHINTPEMAYTNAKDSGEKGYINTFNHVVAQSVLTSFFSKELASFLADIHERKNMPELTTGHFTAEQLKDTANYPEDNYADIINNTIGQKLGLVLQKKYKLKRIRQCTPELFANYLNDLQSYLSWSMRIGLKPFRSDDEVVVRFVYKLNRALNSYNLY